MWFLAIAGKKRGKSIDFCLHNYGFFLEIHCLDKTNEL